MHTDIFSQLKQELFSYWHNAHSLLLLLYIHDLMLVFTLLVCLHHYFIGHLTFLT